MDDIKRKLALIDKQLSGGFFNSYKRIITTSPLVFAAVGLILGILIQNKLLASQLFWFVLLIASAVTAILLFITQRKGKIDSYAPVLLSVCTLIGFACLGAIRLSSFHQPKPDDICNFVSIDEELTMDYTDKVKNDKLKSVKSVAKKIDMRKLATIRGLLVTDPYINRNENWKFARFKFTDPDTSFYLKISELKTVDGWANVDGTIRVQVAEPILDLKAGDYIQAYCWLDRFKPSTNPGQFDTAKYLARKNVFIAASIKSRDGIELLKDRPASIFKKIKSIFRNKATQALLGGPFPEDQSEGLLQALLLGYRRNVDSATYEAFRRTGLLHFISLSGMHLGILVGIIWWLCKTIGLAKRSRAVVCIIAIGVFLVIVPPRAPTLRAAIIAWVFCLSFFFRRRPNSINTLSLAAIILLLIRPTDLFEAGWQLSFSSVLGLVLFCHRIHFFLYEKITGLSWYKKAPKTRPFFRIASRPGPYLLRLFSTGITAWLGGAGILLYHFYTINLLTSVWTVIVFPLVAGILTIGYLKMVLSFLLPTVASILGIFVTGLADLLIRIVKLIAYLDFSQILIGHVPLALIILYYGFILFAGFIYFRRPLLKKTICTVLFVAIIFSLGVIKWQRIHHDNLVITCLDVSHGQAILARLPGRANVLFDAGSLHKSDIGRRTVAPFLDYAGINKIDAVIVSHNDIDHINGVPEIVEHCEIGAVFANDAFFSKTDSWGTAKFLNDRLFEQGHEIKSLGENLNLQSPADIKILWPTKQFSQDYELSDNDKSMVCLIEFADKKILLCSDIEKFAQGELLRLYPDLKADVVVVPHHGSAKTAEPNFLESLDADIFICSCGRNQYEKQQVNSELVEPVIENKDNSRVFYTARDGAITIRVEKDGTITTDVFVE